jgi:hypothetical protein
VFSEYVRLANKLSSDHFSSMPKLRLALYQVSTNDFRWSMTAEEVRWHAFCVTLRRHSRAPRSSGRVETLFRDDMDILVLFDDDRAFVEWHCAEGMCGGYMDLGDGSGTIDPVWVRAICHSLEIVNDPGFTVQPVGGKR